MVRISIVSSRARLYEENNGPCKLAVRGLMHAHLRAWSMYCTQWTFIWTQSTILIMHLLICLYYTYLIDKCFNKAKLLCMYTCINSPVYTRVLTRIQPRFTASVNALKPDCNLDWLNLHPLVDWNPVRNRKWVEPGFELSCKRSLLLSRWQSCVAMTPWVIPHDYSIGLGSIIATNSGLFRLNWGVQRF